MTTPGNVRRSRPPDSIPRPGRADDHVADDDVLGVALTRAKVMDGLARTMRALFTRSAHGPSMA
jgi:hypothetical protein